MQPVNLDHLYSISYNAHRNTHHSPDRIAKTILKDYCDELNSDLQSIGENEQYKTKYIKYFSDWLISRSNVASSFITGPSNFPVKKNQKAAQSADNKYKEFRDWRDRSLKAIDREKKASKPESEVQNEAWVAIDKKIRESAAVIINYDKGINTNWTRSLFVNSITGIVTRIAKNGNSELVKKSLDLIKELNTKGPKPIVRENHSIFKLEQVVEAAREQKVDKQSKENDEYQFSSGLMILNYKEDRVQIKHDSKPLQDVIENLKKNSFRWSPNHQLWQRQLTNAGIYAACQVTGIDIKTIKI